MFTEIKDALIRKIATTYLIRVTDGHKTEIMRVVQAVNMLLLALVGLCGSAPLPYPQLVAACGVVGVLNAKWVILGTVLGHLGLEFGIQDANAKARLAAPPAAPDVVSAKKI